MHRNVRRLAAVLGTGAVVALEAQAADFVKPNVKLGLWEITTAGKASGPPPIPDEVLARLPPERRAQVLASIQGAAGRPMALRQCVTAEKVSQGLQIDRARGDCQRKVVSSSASEMTVHQECSDPSGGQESFDVHFAWASDRVSGTVHVVMTRGARTMSTDRTIEGHWISADCGAVKDVEMLK